MKNKNDLVLALVFVALTSFSVFYFKNGELPFIEKEANEQIAIVDTKIKLDQNPKGALNTKQDSLLSDKISQQALALELAKNNQDMDTLKKLYNELLLVVNEVKNKKKKSIRKSRAVRAESKQEIFIELDEYLKSPYDFKNNQKHETYIKKIIALPSSTNKDKYLKSLSDSYFFAYKNTEKKEDIVFILDTSNILSKYFSEDQKEYFEGKLLEVEKEVVYKQKDTTSMQSQIKEKEIQKDSTKNEGEKEEYRSLRKDIPGIAGGEEDYIKNQDEENKK